MTDLAARPDLATIAARHRPVSVDWGKSSVCLEDGRPWPCDAAALLSEIESLRRTAAEASLDEHERFLIRTAKWSDDLGAAWAAAEAALPEPGNEYEVRWGVQIIPGQPEAWEATAIRDLPNRRRDRVGRGDTPAAALRALTEALRAR